MLVCILLCTLVLGCVSSGLGNFGVKKLAKLVQNYREGRPSTESQVSNAWAYHKESHVYSEEGGVRVGEMGGRGWVETYFFFFLFVKGEYFSVSSNVRCVVAGQIFLTLAL